MAVSDWIKQGPAEKQRVKIMTVDPATRRIEGVLKDGAMIQLAIWEIPAMFVWPRPEEWWTVYKDSGYWMLGSRMEVDEEENKRVEDLESGDGKLGADTIYVPSGARVVTVPAVKPVITGSRGGNAALASMLAAGVTLGLWTDSTTA